MSDEKWITYTKAESTRTRELNGEITVTLETKRIAVRFSTINCFILTSGPEPQVKMFQDNEKEPVVIRGPQESLVREQLLRFTKAQFPAAPQEQEAMPR